MDDTKFGPGVRGICVYVTQMTRIDDLFSSAKLAYMETGGWGIGAGMAHRASADVLQFKQLLVFY